MLLDTNVLLWATVRSRALSQRARLSMESANELVVSATSAYEIEYKRSVDPLLALMPPDLDEAVEALGAHWLPISGRHAAAAGALPRHHKDPWDRVIIAQALALKTPVITNDPKFARYGVEVIW